MHFFNALKMLRGRKDVSLTQKGRIFKRKRMKKITIAIDGFSSCGKSTMAKALAKQVGYIYIDSGAMYRATTLFCIQEGLVADGKIDREGLKQKMSKLKIRFGKDNTTGQIHTYLNDVDVENKIRGMEVSNLVSPVAVIDFVREEMVKQQQAMGTQKGIVMDGRDIGTTVFPDAELKIFLTASAEIRAQRRYDELRAKGDDASYESILKNVQERDHIDQTREVSPLRQADDALLLDNTHMSIAEQDAWLMSAFQKATQD